MSGNFYTIYLHRYPLNDSDLKIKDINVNHPKPINFKIAGIGHLSRFGNYVVAETIFNALKYHNLINQNNVAFSIK